MITFIAQPKYAMFAGLVLSLAGVGLSLTAVPAVAQDIFVANISAAPDQKAVFATVESRRVVPGRSRLGGTVAALAVKEGDEVELGQIIATIGDEKLALQMKSLDAQIDGLQAQLSQTQIDQGRAEDLFAKGTIPRTRLDEARTAFTVANNAMRARMAERAVIQQQLTEGNILAPAAGRVLKVPLTVGTVVLAGDTVAQIAERNFVMRLRVPERDARLLKVGDQIRLDAAELGAKEPRFGTITLVYPQIEDGRVVADAAVESLGDYFVNQRIRVWIASGSRSVFVIPATFIATRFGIDYVKVRDADNRDFDVPVQRGREASSKELPDGIEILSGVRPGDRLVRP